MYWKVKLLQTILLVVQPEDCLVPIDLKDAYFQIPIQDSYQQYLRFAINACNFQFVCLPFGLTTSPWLFTKILVAQIAFLRQMGNGMLHYLDDILVLASSEQTLLHRNLVLGPLWKFGWLVNVLVPQLLGYLGTRINTVACTISLPDKTNFPSSKISVGMRCWGMHAA